MHAPVVDCNQRAHPGQGTGDFRGNPPPGVELAPASADRLLLLPAAGILVFIINLLGGLFFYRKDEQRLVAYLLWTSSVLTPLLMLTSGLLVLFRS